ncbi:MAG TPA: SGNH/GDSL hydrolase family protein [Terriglobales bacterium]
MSLSGPSSAQMCLFVSLAVAAFAQQPQWKPSKGLDEWRQTRLSIYLDDFGELSRYRDENSKLAPPAASKNRVVFFGDSITDMWPLAEYFPGKHYVNRGISGQTTAQMLVRFRQDVIALQPKVVVILAGTNDIAGNTGPISLEEIEANYTTMAELARVHQINVVFSSVLPVHNYTPESQELFADRSPAKIIELNRWLKNYCAANGLGYLDYFSSMVDDKGLLKRDLADDGLHPNKAGYKIMAPLAEAAVGKASKP